MRRTSFLARAGVSAGLGLAFFLSCATAAGADSFGEAVCTVSTLKNWIFGLAYVGCVLGLPVALWCWWAEGAQRRVLIYPFWIVLLLMPLDIGIAVMLDQVPRDIWPWYCRPLPY